MVRTGASDHPHRDAPSQKVQKVKVKDVEADIGTDTETNVETLAETAGEIAGATAIRTKKSREPSRA